MKQFDILDPAETYPAKPLLFEVAVQIYLAGFTNGLGVIDPKDAIQAASDFISSYTDSAGKSNVELNPTDITFVGGIGHHKKGDPPPA